MEDLEITDLIGILNDEVGLLRRLHSILDQQQGALVTGDVDAIHHRVEDQMSVLKAIAPLEERRREALRRLGDARGGAGFPHLESLIEHAPGAQAEKMREIRSSLREILDAIGTVNRHNGMLINQSLSYIDQVLKLVAGEDGTSTVYTPDGEVKSMTGQIVVDRTI
jgi:flagellar biosynthesis/type III secretory pathway chaperone